MSIFSLFTSRKPDVSKYAFVDTEVGTKDHKIHDIGALRYDEATYHGTSKEEKERLNLSAVTISCTTMRNISLGNSLGILLTPSTFLLFCFLNALTTDWSRTTNWFVTN